MSPTETQLYRKAQIWFKECFELEKEGLIGRKFAQHEKYMFKRLLRLRQMAIHWSLVMAGMCKM